MEQPESHISRLARDAGFDTVAITTPDGMARAAGHFDQFLKAGRHGVMAWMADKADRRKSPLTLWPDVRSIIMLGMNYGPAHDPLERLDRRETGNISVYAKGHDYHDIIKKKLKQVARQIHRTYDAEVKVFVDTAPVLEKPLAAKAGLGWQGKHTNLVSRSHGSWLFLGSIFTTLDLKADNPEKDHCGSCRNCLDSCPTGAFPAPYQLDARRCISYLTIEYKGHIPAEFREAMGNRIYGCDDCLAVCPWNKFARRARENRLFPRPELEAPDLADLVELEDQDFREIFSGSPIKRIGRDYFIRNVLIAIGNSGNSACLPQIERKLAEQNAVIRSAAVWALRRLAEEETFAALRQQYMDREEDGIVREEWQK
ncbi:tRNA epoxyqueuosine(34) reductase QueG [Emcibacter nanhaiensis]|uniref:Epoxyqueuosine reductase n=1 Tax=Emcibacter nanhaiensis TaxID=1505037 RepID=A0A501PCP0_9PROT|nr:tRNA epoxyqueuosine(34) reductase QueG [Emcibacter nanhaiensis]TPD57777.1 tRNA epoxyqueuosine(34) reductase QueG [Emcibacter nanhaiensis]